MRYVLFALFILSFLFNTISFGCHSYVTSTSCTEISSNSLEYGSEVEVVQGASNNSHEENEKNSGQPLECSYCCFGHSCSIVCINSSEKLYAFHSIFNDASFPKSSLQKLPGYFLRLNRPPIA